MMGWIETVCAQGVRRPGYDADRWSEDFIAARFEEFGLESVRLEPVVLPRWEPTSWSLTIDGVTHDCFPLPHTAPGTIEGTLGSDIALETVTLNAWPQSFVRERL